MDLSYMVALPVPEPHQSRLAAIQEELRPPGWRITVGPHVTLVPPGIALCSVLEAVQFFQRASSGFAGLKLDYPEAGEFVRRGLATLFLKPIASDDLFELQRRMAVLASAWQDTSKTHRRPFVPHVTLVNRLAEPEADAVKTQLNTLTPVAMEFRSIGLFAKRNKDQTWLQIV